MRYRWKVRLLKVPRVNLWWRQWSARRGRAVGNYADLPGLIRAHAPGKSFADIGCMWGVNGEYAFLAEEAGATRSVGVDVFGPTPEFDEKHAARNSKVEFVLGDATRADTLARIGTVDVVFCAGVLYHHPNPFQVLAALRRICRETLILRTSTIPEIDGLPNAAVFFPMLNEQARALWNLKPLGVLHQAGISAPFDAKDGYGNWFWGLTPSCLESLLATAGFRVDLRATEAFAQTVVCTAVDAPLDHRLPGEDEARLLGAEISAAGVARPA
jgi:2-polyprenyl-3-methyl-5-hydroxy-6-metoxy-1,4-benzoquinol methylase